MKFSADDFKHLYAEMPDEELRSLDPSELTELARQCYHAELARRGPAPPREEPAISEEEQFEEQPEEVILQEEEQDLAPAAIFGSREEAQAARATLQLDAIPAFIENDSEASGSFRLLVEMADLKHARAVLASDGRL